MINPRIFTYLNAEIKTAADGHQWWWLHTKMWWRGWL